MQVVVVGGHTRNIGKTSVMSALIREFATLGWTAVKITQYGHGVCSHDGHACECAPREHPFAVTEERDPATGSDTSRYLAAGARQSLWLRVREGQLGAAVPLLTRRLDCAPSVIIESNSIMEFIDPLLYLVVLDPSRADFKASAGRWIRRAHALVPVENRTASTDEARNGSSAVSGVQLGVRLGTEWGVKVGPDFGAGADRLCSRAARAPAGRASGGRLSASAREAAFTRGGDVAALSEDLAPEINDPEHAS
jgi:hypothetical protein